MNLTSKIAAIVLFASTAALAQDAGVAAAPPPPTPNADEIKRVYDYFQHGETAGPVLVDYKLCLKVDTDKASPTSNECKEFVTGSVKKGTQVTAWTHWFVPKNGKYDDVTLQILLDGQVRETKDVGPLTESWRQRVWKTVALSKPGKWTFKLMRGTSELKTLDVVVDK